MPATQELVPTTETGTVSNTVEQPRTIIPESATLSSSLLTLVSHPSALLEPNPCKEPDSINISKDFVQSVDPDENGSSSMRSDTQSLNEICSSHQSPGNRNKSTSSSALMQWEHFKTEKLSIKSEQKVKRLRRVRTGTKRDKQMNVCLQENIQSETLSGEFV